VSDSEWVKRKRQTDFEPWKSQPRAERAVRLPPVQIREAASGFYTILIRERYALD